MKKTLFKVVVCIFFVFSIVELSAQDDMDDLEKKNFFKIERLENELILLKDQYKFLTEQERLNVENETELEILLKEKFKSERGRINCSLWEEGGKWRWLGIQYVIAEY